MNKIEHIIWDWNGTLVDDAWLFVELMNVVLKKRRLNLINLSVYQEKFCFPLEKYYERLGFDFNVEPYEIASMEFIDLYNKNKYRPVLYEGVIELLKKTIHYDIKNYLLSAQKHDSLLDAVNFYKVGGFFEKICGTNNFHARGKNVLAEKILKTIKNKKSVLFVGDTSMDMTIANQCKSRGIALTCGHHTKDNFKDFNNIKLVNNFKDLGSWLTLKLRVSQ